jgi:hypothetical protein
MIRKKLLLIAGLLVMLFGPVVWSLTADTIFLKNGQWAEGTYLGGNARSIRFRVNNVAKNYPIADVDQVQFGSNTSAASQRFVTFQNTMLSLRHPDNWQVTQDGNSWIIAPSSGRVRDRNGNQALAYGVTLDTFQPRNNQYYQQFQNPNVYGQPSLDEVPNQLIDELQQSNPNMRFTGGRESIWVDNKQALSTHLSNDSPLGGRETNWLITMQRPEGLVYVVFTAQERDFQNYQTVFQQMLDSVRFIR